MEIKIAHDELTKVMKKAKLLPEDCTVVGIRAVTGTIPALRFYVDPWNNEKILTKEE